MYWSVISNVPSVQPTLRINPLNHAVVLYHTPIWVLFPYIGI